MEIQFLAAVKQVQKGGGIKPVNGISNPSLAIIRSLTISRYKQTTYSLFQEISYGFPQVLY